MVLKEFHVHSLTSKKSSYDYIAAICHLTDNIDPNSVKVSNINLARVLNLTIVIGLVP